MGKRKLVFIIGTVLAINIISGISVDAAVQKVRFPIKDNYVSLRDYVTIMEGTFEKVTLDDNYGYEVYPKYKYFITLNGGMEKEDGKTIEVFENAKGAYVNGKFISFTTKNIDGFNIPGDDKISDVDEELRVPVEFFENSLDAVINEEGKLEIRLPEKIQEGNIKDIKKEGKNENTNTSNFDKKPESKPPEGSNSEKPSKPVEPPKVENIYTGKIVKDKLINAGFNTGAQGQWYFDSEYGHEQIMTFVPNENIWDMIFTVNKIPEELVWKVQEACEIILPGHGGTLYNAILKWEPQNLKIGDRWVGLTVEWYGVDVKISGINR